MQWLGANFTNVTSGRTSFDITYVRSWHITMLLSIDGFLSAQRYECTHGATAPFLAVYKQRDAGVIDFRRFRKNKVLYGDDVGKIVKVMRPEQARDSERAQQLRYEEEELRREEEYGEELFVDNAPKKGRR